MPEPILYQRGPYQLRWDRTKSGALRSPFLQIFWYSFERKREVSASAGTGDVREGRRALDRHYLTHQEGEHFCNACGQPLADNNGVMVADAIADYLAQRDDKTLSARLGHVVDYLGTLPTPDVRCDQIDEKWIGRFRTWAAKQPVVYSSGVVREEPRAPSTIENSIIQLASAIREKRLEPHFKPIATKELNRTPRRRLSIKEMADGFRYATASVDANGRQVGTDRVNLHRFLVATVATLARPDAVHDISTDPKRDQWHSNSRILDLNPKGRRPTKKRRAIVLVPYQFARHLDRCKGAYITAKSVRSAHDSMCKALGWPKDRENGMKLWRRSVGQLLRDPARSVPSEQIELQLGHRRIDSVTDLYAGFDPTYLREATKALEAIIDEIEALVPGAFHRTDTGAPENIIPLGASKNA
jgi:hypothetical protein